jgi:alkylhydroperoxidase/carboxymuconolactone decarboxylase family protein YurZ
MEKTTNGFQILMRETGGVGPAFMNAVQTMSRESALDEKTHELTYLAVLTALRMYGGLPFHVQRAKQLGATLEEVKSAGLVPLPVIGVQTAEALPILINSYQDEG